MYLTVSHSPLMRKQLSYCHSERSGAESKNLKCRSQRKAEIERPSAVFTLGHDTSAALAVRSCCHGL